MIISVVTKAHVILGWLSDTLTPGVLPYKRIIGMCRWMGLHRRAVSCIKFIGKVRPGDPF